MSIRSMMISCANRTIDKATRGGPNPVLIAVDAAIVVGHEIVQDRLLEATLTAETV